MRTHIRSWSAIIVLLLAAIVLISLFSVPARAAGPWYVASTGSDGNTCLSAGSPCATINGAIAKASSGDTVYVATGTYTSISGNEVVLIDKDINLSGGWDQTFTAQTGASTIDGGAARFGITVGSWIVTIEQFAIHNCTTGGHTGINDGSGIRNYGTLTLNNSTVSENAYYGIYNVNTLTLNNSTVSDNANNIAGGGIYNLGTLTLNNSTVSGNGGASFGGGIDSTGTLTLNNSTVGGNTGAGIFIHVGTATLNHSIISNNTENGIHSFGALVVDTSTVQGNTLSGIYSTGPLTVNNSTISDNIGMGIYSSGTLILDNSAISGNMSGGIKNWEGTAALNNSTINGNQNGGGIDSGGISNGGTLTINNSTISGNTGQNLGGIRNGGILYMNNSTVSGNTVFYSGGGINNMGTMTMQNSILAGNSIVYGLSPDCYGSISSAGYNLIGNTSDCTVSGNTTGNITGRDPLLGPLQNNGGPTYTQALLLGSPAINAGNPAGCTDQLGNPLVTDQRGKPRLGRCDMGAYELQPLGFSTKLADRQIGHPGKPITYTITLDNPGAAEITGVQLADALPAHLGYLNGSLTASKGQASYQNGVISWNGTLSAQEQVQVAFAATVDDFAPFNQPITNTAVIQGGGETFLRDTAVLVEPYQIALPVILRPCFPLYSDNFSNPASGWFVGDDGDNRYEYLNGEYRILVRPTQWGAIGDPGFQASDYSVAVNLRNPNAVDGSYGIAFGIAGDWSTFYTLEIYPNGWYGIYRYDPTAIVTLSEAYSSAIYQGSATNQIKVERNGASINAYANGQLLASVADGTYTGSLYIGLIVFSYNQRNVDIRFDNFTVYSSSCSSTNASLSTTGGDLALPHQRFFNFSRVEKGHAMPQR